jgi:hypothetical protein
MADGTGRFQMFQGSIRYARSRGSGNQNVQVVSEDDCGARLNDMAVVKKIVSDQLIGVRRELLTCFPCNYPLWDFAAICFWERPRQAKFERSNVS